jgi:Glutamyl- and glutaminyl-tRNA synthetases
MAQPASPNMLQRLCARGHHQRTGALGWSHGDEEIFTSQQLVAWFNLECLSASPARFDAAKFEWVNGEHLKRMPLASLAERLQPFLAARGYGPSPSAHAVAELLRERAPTLAKMAEMARYCFEPPAVDPALLASHLTEHNRPALQAARAALAALGDWGKPQLAALLKAVQTEHGLKPPQLLMPLRILLTGTTQAPAVEALLATIGREASLARLALLN